MLSHGQSTRAYQDLQRLQEAVRGIERRWDSGPGQASIPTGWDPIDRHLGVTRPRLGEDTGEDLAGQGLVTGAIHEWYGCRARPTRSRALALIVLRLGHRR